MKAKTKTRHRNYLSFDLGTGFKLDNILLVSRNLSPI
jgi:hypothetical protein